MIHGRHRWWIWTIIILGFLSFLTGCNYRRGWVEVTYSDRLRATYSLFNGQNGATVGLAAGESVSLTYDLEISKGSITLQVIDPDRKVIWEEDFCEDGTGSTSIPAALEGKYQFVVLGEKTRGSFDLHWEITEK
jgi:hypothetical protein